MKVKSVESVPFSKYLYLCNVYVTSGPSLLIESTDSMITRDTNDHVHAGVACARMRHQLYEL